MCYFSSASEKEKAMPNKNWSPNSNHPKKGSKITVDPIYRISDIYKVLAVLKHKPRDYCLFILGINTGYRASDLVSIKVGDVQHLKAWDPLSLKEKKTGKIRTVIISDIVLKAIHQWLLVHPNSIPKAPLFPSQKTGNVLLPRTVTAMVKSWCEEAGVRGHYGSHTLRKTFARHQFKSFHTQLPVIQQDLGHETQEQTLQYLSIRTKDHMRMFKHQLGGGRLWLYFKLLMTSFMMPSIT